MQTRTPLLGVLGMALLMLVPAVSADVAATLGVDPGSTALLTLEIEVTGVDGTEIQSDSRVVSLGGDGAARFTPNEEPFDGMILDALVLRPGECTLDYEFFCNPVFGCVSITVDLRNITATLQGPAAASIVGDQVGWGANWRLLGDYTISSILFNSGGIVDTTTAAGFNGRLSVGDGGWRLDQMSLGTITSDVPGDALPSGVSVRLRTTLGLGGAALGGNYTIPPPQACGAGGDCNEPHGGPGCDDVACCDAVCDIDPACCTAIWDDGCAATAVAACAFSPANDRCDQPRDLPLGRFEFSTLNADTDGSSLPTACVDEGTGGVFVNDVWFTHTAVVDNGVFVSTCGHADFDTRIAVYTGCDGAIITCSDDVVECPGGTSRCGFYGIAGETYLIRVGGKFGAGSGEIDIALGDVVPPDTEIAPVFADGLGANGHSYAVVSLIDGNDWTDAVSTAARFGGYPATLASPQETGFVTTFAVPSEVGGPTTFGLLQSARGAEPAGGWGWITGEEFYYNNWNAGEPNDAGKGEDFGIIYRSGLWNDGAEGFGHVLVEFDTPPSLDEVVWSTDLGGDGSRYQAVIGSLPLSWQEAKSQAEALGGSLVCLETEAEADFLFDNLVRFHSLWTMTNYNGGPWVGLEIAGGEWRWLSGVPFDWAGWMPGEPNGTGDKGCFYSYLDGPRRQFDDTFDGNLRRAFIVEFEPDPVCLGDVNDDGQVNGADLGLLLGEWGLCPKGCAADLNDDGQVNGADLGLMLGGWGLCP